LPRPRFPNLIGKWGRIRNRNSRAPPPVLLLAEIGALGTRSLSPMRGFRHAASRPQDPEHIEGRAAGVWARPRQPRRQLGGPCDVGLAWWPLVSTLRLRRRVSGELRPCQPGPSCAGRRRLPRPASARRETPASAKRRKDRRRIDLRVHGRGSTDSETRPPRLAVSSLSAAAVISSALGLGRF
jgi:hypothetical protein